MVQFTFITMLKTNQLTDLQGFNLKKIKFKIHLFLIKI